ncbi:glycosyltransferase [Rubrivivax gelatinosus]|uniref:glycosyltransferase n=1 Tax=Rubrivivax gelatinosus TaxID=28068 RepID=UPI0002E16FB9|nr:glycosyltransferase [Rubrivivax gelatinosus]MBG6080391.1 glycosyltransferase involved in cell wall biosynthesis [Rubrivivax gelatinosus]
MPEAGSVDVVLCAYNGQRYVGEQLRSVLAQTRPVDRVLVRDDGSTDATLDEVARCAAEAPGLVHAVRNERNLGFAGNFAAGLAAAQADVVFFCDQDDVWEPEKVRLLLELLQSSGADMVFSDGVAIDAGGARIPGPTVLQALELEPAALDGFARRAWDELVRRNVVNGAACAVRRRVAQAALPVPPGMAHDYWLALWCAAHGGVAATARTLYRYRQHGANVIGMGSQRRLWQWLGVWRQPRRPRRRELALWRLVCERLLPLLPEARRASLREKLAFLEETVGTPARTSRAVAILRHLARGSYRRFAPPWALARDLIGLLRDPDRGAAP